MSEDCRLRGGGRSFAKGTCAPSAPSGRSANTSTKEHDMERVQTEHALRTITKQVSSQPISTSTVTHHTVKPSKLALPLKLVLPPPLSPLS